MLDIKFIRENPEKVKTRLAMRTKNYDNEIDRLIRTGRKAAGSHF